uniref:Uncharacterized protein n=1 Tax=Vitis vinifera TaxID=29760 RepID=F6HVP0_VITVI
MAHFFLWSWVSQASNPPITFARLSQQVILVPTKGSLFLVAQLRKSSLHWISLSILSTPGPYAHGHMATPRVLP